jgi:formate-dependent phosphoribosylglycinamide formyltransferase (GAR transformylase)
LFGKPTIHGKRRLGVVVAKTDLNGDALNKARRSVEKVNVNF